ncbi:MAG: translation initiation factor IF-2, partial [Dehalococcoidia bacterium]|nr:translation initiation factor IF-2 [Dehalococcoidia bacterium]
MPPDNLKSSPESNSVPSHNEEKSSQNEATAAAPQIELPLSLTVQHLAEILKLTPITVVKQLMRNGIMANVNQSIDYDIAAGLSRKLGYNPKPKREVSLRRKKTLTMPGGSEKELQQKRPPVVTVMGHVDHGKTRLLDAIRKANVIDTEAGGITQHIGAYQTEIKGHKITFLDTPGHQAFTAMRARGARVTDITVLVVAADDGIMPQTIEAINHSRAAEVPIIVAINKIDKPDVNIDRIKQQLADHELLIEEWGGDVICVLVSAKENKGIDDLLENILILAEMLELTSDPKAHAKGVVIEAKLDKNRGPEATTLVQSGTLKLGNIVVAGAAHGKIKAMFDDKGRPIKTAGPSTPVEILGLDKTPQAGDIITSVPTERRARTMIAQQKITSQRESLKDSRGRSLSSISSQILKGEVKELNIILKTDVRGSIEPVRNSLKQLGTDQVKINIIHSDSGSITEGDVLLSLASKGIIVGFNTKPEPGAKQLASREKVDIRCYDIIYNLTDDIQKAMSGMLEPEYAEVVEGHAEVRAIFSMKKGAKIAGVYITDG